MRVNMVFKLPEEQDEYQYAMDGVKYAIVIEELDNALRAMYKYQDKEVISIEEVRQMLNNLLTERGLI